MSTAKITHWLYSHKESASKSIARILQNPLSFSFTTLLIAIAFAVPMGIYILFSSVEQLTEQWDSDRQITIFLTQEVSFDHAQKLAKEFSGQSDIEIAHAVNKEEVLKEFKRETNFNLFPESIGGNPLPHIIVVAPTIDAHMSNLTENFKSMAEVQHVQFDLLWFQRLQAFSNVILRIQWIISILLFFYCHFNYCKCNSLGDC